MNKMQMYYELPAVCILSTMVVGDSETHIIYVNFQKSFFMCIALCLYIYFSSAFLMGS